MNKNIVKLNQMVLRWYLENPIGEMLGVYQNHCRIYLDEYEVEEWGYLPLFDNTFITQRFMEKK
jgi:hypothetical protein